LPLPQEDIFQEALRLVEQAAAEGVEVRLVGGLAVRALCLGEPPEPFRRSYKDIDLAGLSSASSRIQAALTQAGYIPDKAFNSLHGRERLFFWDPVHERQVDVFLDQMKLCHTIDFRAELPRHPRTLPPTELLLSKLQIVEVNEKDLRDALFLLHLRPLGDRPDTVEAARLARLLADDWGLWRTVTGNLEKLDAYARTLGLDELRAPIAELGAAIEQAPKSLKWRLRSRIGERVRWYELPEEEAHDPPR
jgi:hypothetical protein